jgi:enediyne biosynthesis protein E4
VRAFPLLTVSLTALALSSCEGGREEAPAQPPSQAIVFEEVTGPGIPQVAQTMYVPNNGFNSGLGAAVGDVDGDGRLDVYLAGGGVFFNRPDPSGFRLEPAPGSPPPDARWIGAAFGDYDRDGDLDLARCGQGGVELWANDGAGSFTDVTATAGVGGASGDISLSVAWGDLDGDGYLDLAVANYGFSGTANDAQASRLHLSRRDGTFAELGSPIRDVSVRAWVVTLADFDGDGRLDLHLGDDLDIPFTHDQGPRHDRVFVNRGLDADGRLSLIDASDDLALGSARATMGCAVGNAAHGAGWDLFFADINAGWLFRSEVPGQRYRDATSASHIDLSGGGTEQWWQWGSVFSDLDGDGFEDLLVSQSAIYLGQDGVDRVGPVLLRNHDGTFDLVRDVFGGPMNTRAIVTADLDGDGDEDCIAAPFFDRFRFFVNRTGERHFLRITLEPTVSAPGAAGAVVVARTGDITQKRMRFAGGQPHSSGGEVIDFGLGDATSADLEITWPSGAVQHVGDAKGSVTLTEPRWISVDPARPPADGVTHVKLSVDVRLAGLGDAGTEVRWTSVAGAVSATVGDSGIAVLDLPPRSVAGTIRGTITIDEREIPAHPALDYSGPLQVAQPPRSSSSFFAVRVLDRRDGILSSHRASSFRRNRGGRSSSGRLVKRRERPPER